MIRIAIDVSDLIGARLALMEAGKKTPRAITRAMNRAGDQAFTKARQSLQAQTGIKAGDTRRSKGLFKIPARPDRLELRIIARSPTTPLSYFSPSQRAEGVYARPWARGQLFRGTFLLTMKSGHVGVFKREGTQRQRIRSNVTGRRMNSQGKIKELWGPSLGRELGRDPTASAARDTYRQALPGRIDHEIRFALGQITPRPKKP